MKKVTCLLIDDDDDDYEIFLETVNKISDSIDCHRATNGKDGILKLKSGEVDPDIIFLDINMPIMNGPQFLGEYNALNRKREVRIVLMSTTWSDTNLQETRSLGINDFIIKPYTMAEWETSLRKALKSLL